METEAKRVNMPYVCDRWLGEKVTFCEVRIEFPLLILNLAVNALVPEYDRKTSTGNLFFKKAYLLTFN
jgi:hypothetical protein